jgi:hypothetical protein
MDGDHNRNGDCLSEKGVEQGKRREGIERWVCFFHAVLFCNCWKKRYQRALPRDLDWYLDVLVKHTTVDSASNCLSRRRIVKIIYFKL